MFPVPMQGTDRYAASQPRAAFEDELAAGLISVGLSGQKNGTSRERPGDL